MHSKLLKASIASCFVALALASMSGCATVFTRCLHVDCGPDYYLYGKPVVCSYRATRFDVQTIEYVDDDASVEVLATITAILDLPLSLAIDTVCFPWDVSWDIYWDMHK